MSDLRALIRAAEDANVEVLESILRENPGFVSQKDETGATALHCAAWSGHRPAVELLVKRGADVNSRDGKFGATPTGWTIEYLRELGGFLGIELDDFAYAISLGDARWVRRWLTRFPNLRSGRDPKGVPFRQLALERGNPKIIQMFSTEG